MMLIGTSLKCRNSSPFLQATFCLEMTPGHAAHEIDMGQELQDPTKCEVTACEWHSSAGASLVAYLSHDHHGHNDQL